MAKKKASGTLALSTKTTPETTYDQASRAERFKFLDDFPRMAAALELYLQICSTRLAVYCVINSRFANLLSGDQLLQLPFYPGFYTRLLGSRSSENPVDEILQVLNEASKFDASRVSLAVGHVHQIANKLIPDGPSKEALINFLSFLCLAILTMRSSPGPHYKNIKRRLSGQKLLHVSMIQHILVLLIELDRQTELLTLQQNISHRFNIPPLTVRRYEHQQRMERLAFTISCLRSRIIQACQVYEELSLENQYPENNPVHQANIALAAAIDKHSRDCQDRHDQAEFTDAACEDLLANFEDSDSPPSCILISDTSSPATPLSMAVGERLEDVLNEDDEDGGRRHKRQDGY